MSKFVDEIIKQLRECPTLFEDFKGQGVIKGDIEVTMYGNSSLLSLIDVRINGNKIPTSYRDRWRLEAAIKDWYKSIPLWVLLSSNNKSRTK